MNSTSRSAPNVTLHAPPVTPCAPWNRLWPRYSWLLTSAKPAKHDPHAHRVGLETRAGEDFGVFGKDALIVANLDRASQCQREHLGGVSFGPRPFIASSGSGRYQGKRRQRGRATHLLTKTVLPHQEEPGVRVCALRFEINDSLPVIGLICPVRLARGGTGAGTGRTSTIANVYAGWHDGTAKNPWEAPPLQPVLPVL